MEDIAADPAVWEYILAREPTAKEKALSFFRKAARDYSFDEGMSREARRYLRHFKKLFDSFSERNFQGNAAESQVVSRRADGAPKIDGKLNADATARMALSDAIVNPSVKKTSENTAESSGNSVRYTLSDSGKEYLEFKNADNKAPTVSPDIRYALREGAESDVERIVVCAPIKIGEADYYMGVMLQRDSRYQRLYLHNVVSVAIEREATSSSKDNLVTTGALENENHLSITSIIQKALNVKAEKQKNIAQTTENNGKNVRYALSETSNANDAEYLRLAKDPKSNEVQLRRMVEDAARANGFDSPMLYHGTDTDRIG